MTRKEIDKLLKRDGWEIIHGSNHDAAVKNPDFPGEKIPLPRHKGDIPKGTENS
ncbi:MAG: type II toxin-antitoxin system HicA family toxin, partial [Ruminococcus sp.]|nr:type II toxin-antitoxin system HicA family toxin [Ruminococcus sp.]